MITHHGSSGINRSRLRPEVWGCMAACEMGHHIYKLDRSSIHGPPPGVDEVWEDLPQILLNKVDLLVVSSPANAQRSTPNLVFPPSLTYLPPFCPSNLVLKLPLFTISRTRIIPSGAMSTKPSRKSSSGKVCPCRLHCETCRLMVILRRRRDTTPTTMQSGYKRVIAPADLAQNPPRDLHRLPLLTTQ